MKRFRLPSLLDALVLSFTVSSIFTSAVNAATVTTSAATGVGGTNATLNGSVNPEGVATRM